MRRINSYVAMGILLGAGMLMAACETTDTESSSTMGTPTTTSMAAAEPAPAPGSEGMVQTTPAAPSESRAAPAAGAMDDTLQACMARIPNDSTASQRMLGERTCQRDEEMRQPFLRAR